MCTSHCTYYPTRLAAVLAQRGGLKANAPAAGPHNLPSIAALKHYCISGAVRCLRGCWLVGHRAAKGLIFGAWGVDLAACGLHLAAEGRHMQHIAENVAYGAVWLATG